jgi:hypothetical protein
LLKKLVLVFSSPLSRLSFFSDENNFLNKLIYVGLYVSKIAFYKVQGALCDEVVHWKTSKKKAALQKKAARKLYELAFPIYWKAIRLPFQGA